MKNLAEWVRRVPHWVRCTSGGPCQCDKEAALRRAELLERLYESVKLEQLSNTMGREEMLSVDWKSEEEAKFEILAALAMVEK